MACRGRCCPPAVTAQSDGGEREPLHYVKPSPVRSVKMSASGAGGCGPGPGSAPGAGSGASNPRKFSEKIALHTQRQAEETAAFQEVMMDISSTRVRRTLRRQEEAEESRLVAAEASGSFGTPG